MSDHQTGWRADLEAPVRAAWAASGRYPLLSRSMLDADDKPLPSAMSLSGLVRYWYNQGSVGSCFPIGTHVKMADGTSRPIESLNIGEPVRTAEGRVGLVTATMSRYVDDVLTVVKVTGHPPLVMTDEHPVRTRRGYVRAADLRYDDFVAVVRSDYVVWRDIAALGQTPYVGMVHNLEVAGDNSYVAGNIGVHNCFANAAAQGMQISTAAAVTAGEPFEVVQLSRRMAWHEGRKVDGILGQRGDGGTINGVLRALNETGLCRETTAPYKPDHNALEAELPEQAYTEGKQNHLTGILPLQADDTDGRKRSILNGLPIVPGIWWPGGWDGAAIDEYGRTNDIGNGGFGHALVIAGWADPGVFDDNHLWWEYINSHGPIYPVLPKRWSDRVPGYATARPDKSYSFWVRDDLEARITSVHYELVAVTGVAGFKIRSVVSWADGFA